ncbi:hypothetical protein IHE61_25915 [Streptomyces sp. GKU 257-1]|nr:hypothetical protein [Streptomyces sp. GKU 257-1]
MPTTYEPAEVPGWPAYAFVVRDSGRVAVSGPLLPAAEHPTPGPRPWTRWPLRPRGSDGRCGPRRPNGTAPCGTW